MNDQTIKCPQCSYDIPLTEALSNQIRQQLQTEVDQRAKEQEQRLKADRDALDAREKELALQQQSLDEQVKEKVQKETARVSADARRKAEEEFGVQLKTANSELEEKRERIKEFQQNELELAKERESLAEQRETLELDKQRHRDTVRAELEAEYQKKQKAALAQAREDAARLTREQYEPQLQQAQDELEQKNQKVREFQDQQLTLRKEKQQLEDDRATLELDKQRQRDTVRAELETEYQQKQNLALIQAREDAARQTREQYELQLQQTQDDLEQKNQKVRELQDQQLALRKEKQQLEDDRAALELDVQRRLDDERKALVDTAKKNAADEQKLNLRQRDDLINKLEEQLSEAQRQIGQGSQERQGEMLEEELIEVLRRAFPFDQFENIKKGARGADVMQTVCNPQGKPCGRILWESKNSKSYDKNWLTKLKKDRQESGAELAVLMTITMPAGVERFGVIEDVWVTDFKSALNLCAALRQTLMLVERERLITQHADSLKDVIYQYVTGQEFTTRVKMIYSAYENMLGDLETEKRSMQRQWKKRETQIRLVMDNIIGMRGELEGIVGGQKALPAFEPLSLDSIAENDENEGE